MEGVTPLSPVVVVSHCSSAQELPLINRACVCVFVSVFVSGGFCLIESKWVIIKDLLDGEENTP